LLFIIHDEVGRQDCRLNARSAGAAEKEILSATLERSDYPIEPDGNEQPPRKEGLAGRSIHPPGYSSPWDVLVEKRDFSFEQECPAHPLPSAEV
jgi:hypothetical protein